MYWISSRQRPHMELLIGAAIGALANSGCLVARPIATFPI
jgi:hypothetical protein